MKHSLDSHWEEQIAAALAGNLSEGEQEELNRHLAAHPEARRTYEETLAMNHLLEKILKKDEPDAGFEERMVQKFQRQRRSRELGFWKQWSDLWQGHKSVYVGALAALVLSFYLGGVDGSKPLAVEKSKEGFSRREAEITQSQEAQKAVDLYFNSPDPLHYDSWREEEGKDEKAANVDLKNFEETSKKGVVLSGYVDAAAYGFEKEKGKNQSDGGAAQNQPTQRGDFNLNAVKIALEKPLSNENKLQAGFRSDIMLGDDKQKLASSFSVSSPATPSPKPMSAPSSSDADLRKSRENIKMPVTTTATVPAAAPESDTEVANEIQRKLVRNANIGLEVKSYADSLQALTRLAQEEKGYVATQNDRTQANGHTAGQIVIKLAPDRLDDFVLRLRDVGTIKHQVLRTEDVTKAYFDTQARLRNASKTEERLLELMAKKTDKVADLLQVEKEIARVRESIEQMQGELKLWDSLSSLATVTIDLVEEDMDQAADYLLKERANLSVYSPDVEKAYQEARDFSEKAGAQILTAQVNRAGEGQMNATLSLLAAPERAFALIEQLKTLGRVQSFDQTTERVAQDGKSGIAGSTRRDKVEIQLVIVHDDASRKNVTLQVITTEVEKALDQCKKAAMAASGEILASNLQRSPSGHSQAVLTVRLPANRVAETQAIFSSQGRVLQLSVQRNDNTGANAEDEDRSPVILSLTLSDEEPPVQITRLDVQGEKVASKVEDLKGRAQALGIDIRSSSFSRNPDGVEQGILVFRLTQKDYPALLQALQDSGKTVSLTLERRDRVEQGNGNSGSEPVELQFRLKSPSPIVPDENGLMKSLRQTLGQSFGMLMASLERIVTGFAYLLPWLVAGGIGWLIWRRIRGRKKD